MTPKTTARLTGLAYLGMVPASIVAFMNIQPKLLDLASASGTLAALQAQGDLARLGLASMLVVVVSQALSAWGFYALFRERHPVAAFGVASFGLVNAAAILAGATATAAAIALAATPAEPGAAAVVQALYLFQRATMSTGGLFFGLWLIPMGWAAWRSGAFHAGQVLGWILMGGGVLYVLGAFLALVPEAAAAGVPDMLAMPATVGELWMIGALCAVGVRR